MKLDFDPKKNITKLDYFMMQLNRVSSRIKDLLVVQGIVKNWYDVLLFRIGLKNGFVIHRHNSQIKMCLFVFVKYPINNFDIITNLA